MKNQTEVTLKRVFSTIGLAIVSVLVLASATGIFSTIPSGFNRKLIGSSPMLHYSITKPASVTTISSIVDNYAYFNTQEYSKIYRLNIQIRKLQLEHTLYQTNIKPVKGFEYEMYSGNTIFYAKNERSIFRNATMPYKLQLVAKLPTIFTQGVSLSPSTFVVRMFDKKASYLDQSFVKLNERDTAYLTSQLTPVLYDAGIATDGTLKFDRKNNIITYTYFYSNKIICMDTNLNLIHYIKTIDTFSNFYNKGAAANNRNDRTKMTNAKPALMINLGQSISNGLIYNLSMLKADDQSKTTFKNNSAIDIYDIKKGLYIGSFYLPNINGEKILSFDVNDDLLIAVYKTSIAAFRVPT